ncbi:MAG TPA: DUF4382 domain-containing protein [Acidobacteriota bacterium]|nr:DUF4382 domain-containing protein [Acidobacteriota bacterium]
MRKNAPAICMIGLLALVGLGCVEHQGQLGVFLTAANAGTTLAISPQQVTVEIVGVDVLDSESGNFVTLSAGSQLYEILGLDGNQQLLALADRLDEGTYQQIRLRFSEVNSTVVNAGGRREKLKIDPEAVTVGIPFTVQTDGSTQVIIALDIDQSLSQKSNGRWVLRPVLRPGAN